MLPVRASLFDRIRGLLCYLPLNLYKHTGAGFQSEASILKSFQRFEFEMEQQSINQRINFLLKAFKMSARTFSEAIGESPTNTQNYVGKRNAEPRAGYLENVLRHFETVNPLWLLTGEGEPFIADAQSGITQTGNFNQAGTHNKQTIKGNKGNVIGTNHGTATQNTYTLTECEKELDGYRNELEKAQREVEYLTGKLQDKEALLAAKDDTINLLRAGFNRPN